MAEEIFDIVDEKGQPTGETVTRTQAHEEGIRHRTVHIWVTRENGDKTEVLLQKRAMNKDSYPGKYDTSSAGHIRAGDEPLESAVRELAEELGIHVEPDDLNFLGTLPIQYEEEFYGKTFKDNQIAFVYVYDDEAGIDNLTIQEEEVDSVKWFDINEVYEACKPPRDDNFCLPLQDLNLLRKYIAEEEESTNGMIMGMLLGMAIGVAIGASNDNIPLWMCLGMSIGMCFGMIMKRKS
jgi:isopentenyldiphosphate isomerase